jgi:hypothetical protein
MAAPLGNLFALGNKGGRPPFYKTATELEEKINEYFDWLVDKETGLSDIPTITGLALYLGFNDTDSLFDQQKRSQEFSGVVKRAKKIVEAYHEKRLSGTTPTGSIFWLKNFGWKDQVNIDHTNAGTAFKSFTDEELRTLAAKILDSGDKR